MGDLSSRHLAEEMRKKYESKIDQFSSCDVELLNALAEDQLSSALISSEEKGLKALQTTGDGNCLYNSASVLIEGDQSANLILRLLTAVELYLNPDYYAEHPKVADGRSSRFSDTTIFTLLLSDSTQKEFERQASRVDAVQAQAIITCKEKKYGTLLNMMALATVLNQPLMSQYPKFKNTSRIHPLMSGVIKPRGMVEGKDESGSAVFRLLWTRDGNFDNRPGAVFQPNHFVPVIQCQSAPRPPTLMSGALPTQKDRTPLVGKSRAISSFFKPTSKASATKRTATEAVVNSNESSCCAKVPKTSSVTRKFQDSWKNEFPWVIYDPGANTMFCDLFCKAGSKIAGKTEFVTGSKTIKKETLKKHGESHGHLRAQDFVINEQKPLTKRPIFKGLKKAAEKIDEQAYKEMSVKMNTVYFIAKEELPFTKFPGLLQLQQKNGIQITSTYSNDIKCAEMVATVGTLIKEEIIAENLRNEVRYISVMIDGATDASSTENETVYARCLGTDGRPVNRMVGHEPVEHAHADGKL